MIPRCSLVVDYSIFHCHILLSNKALESSLQLSHHVSNHANHCVCLQWFRRKWYSKTWNITVFHEKTYL
jgi:hypothetical protein